MKALYRSTWCRFVLLLMLAAFMAAGAAVPVGATDTIDYIGYNYILKDSTGTIILSQEPLYIVPFSNSSTVSSAFTTNYIGFGTIGKSDIIVLTPFESDNQTHYHINMITNSTTIKLVMDLNYNVTTSNSFTKFYILGTSLGVSRFDFILSLEGVGGRLDPRDFLPTYQQFANYPPLYQYDGYPTEVWINTPTVDLDYTLSDAIGKPGLTEEQIYNAIKLALDEQTNTIINIGSEYIQFLPTRQINELSSAQDNLSSAEGALQDKSKSLRDGVSSQWQNNINTTKNFVSTITPATTAITSTMTQIVAVMPEEVQALLIVIPLLLFIGWLIGRIEGG